MSFTIGSVANLLNGDLSILRYIYTLIIVLIRESFTVVPLEMGYPFWGMFRIISMDFMAFLEIFFGISSTKWQVLVNVE